MASSPAAVTDVLAPPSLARHVDEDLGSSLARERLELGARCKSLAASLISASMAAGDEAAWKPISEELAAAIDQLAEMPPQPVFAWIVLSDAGQISHIAHNTSDRDLAMSQGKRLVPLSLAAPCLTPFAGLHGGEHLQSTDS